MLVYFEFWILFSFFWCRSGEAFRLVQSANWSLFQILRKREDFGENLREKKKIFPRTHTQTLVPLHTSSAQVNNALNFTELPGNGCRRCSERERERGAIALSTHTYSQKSLQSHAPAGTTRMYHYAAGRWARTLSLDLALDWFSKETKSKVRKKVQIFFWTFSLASYADRQRRCSLAPALSTVRAGVCSAWKVLGYVPQSTSLWGVLYNFGSNFSLRVLRQNLKYNFKIWRYAF